MMLRVIPGALLRSPFSLSPAGLGSIPLLDGDIGMEGGEPDTEVGVTALPESGPLAAADRAWEWESRDLGRSVPSPQGDYDRESSALLGLSFLIY